MSGMSQRTNILEFSSLSQIWADSGEGAKTGRFGAIQIMEDGTTFSDLTLPEANDATLAEGLTYNKGEVLYGLCTGFTVSAGTVCAHTF
jgi:hypothetical protein